MPNSVPSSNGARAAEAAARKYGLKLWNRSNGYFDASYKSNGLKVQIKSARYERADGPGVFRVWKENLELLSEHRGSVVLAVVNPSNPERKVLKITRRSPGDLLERGDFRPTGQDDMKGKSEARIPWPEVVTL